jgi:hypothetical protein
MPCPQPQAHKSYSNTQYCAGQRGNSKRTVAQAGGRTAGVRDRAAGQQASNSKPKEAGLAAAEQRECGTGRPDSKRATASQRRRGWRRPYSEAGGGRTGGAERLSKGEGGGCTGEGGGCTGRSDGLELERGLECDQRAPTLDLGGWAGIGLGQILAGGK